MDSQHITVLLLVPRSLPPFIPRSLNVVRILPRPDEITIEAATRWRAADCLDCGTITGRPCHGRSRKARR